MEEKRYEAYTDGGCNNLSPYGEGAAAYVITDGRDIVKKGSKAFLNTTNNRMEMLAIVSVLYNLPNGSSVTIFTDSRYCIKSFTSPRNTAYMTNGDLVRLFRVYSIGKSVTFSWVKGHDGNEFNEMCDKMCTEKREEIRKANGIPVYSRKNSPKVKHGA